MSAEQTPPFLNNPLMLELLDIARTLEVSVLQAMDEAGCTVTAFYQHQDGSREILAERTGADMFDTTKAAVCAAIEHIDRVEGYDQ
jgi:hypothetical protein